MITLRYNLENKKHVSIKSFAIRETNGKDEDRAALLARAKGGAATMLEELVRLSLVEVDGQAVNTDPAVPYVAFDEWNSRTRTFVLNAYKRLNGITEEDNAEGFLASGELIPG
jgi:hypothetical protein